MKHGPNAEDGFVVDTKEAGSVTGFLHIMTPGEADSAFATIKAEGDAKASCQGTTKGRVIDHSWGPFQNTPLFF